MQKSNQIGFIRNIIKEYYKSKINSIFIYTYMTHIIQGINLEDFGVVKLNKEMLKGIDLENFPPERVHFLAHALQTQSKMPSQQSMLRTEIRNEKKMNREQANQVIGRPKRRDMVPKKHKRTFHLPYRYGPKPMNHPRGINQRGGRRGRAPIDFSLRGNPVPIPRIGPPMMGMMPQQIPPLTFPPGFAVNTPFMMPPPIQGQFINHPPPFVPIPPFAPMRPQVMNVPPPLNLPPYNPSNQASQVPPGFALGGVVNPQMLKTSHVPVDNLKPVAIQTQEEKEKERAEKGLPSEVVRKHKQRKASKEKSKAVKITPPECIALKCERAIYQRQIEAARLQLKKQKEPELVTNLHNALPDYFRKKKASQKRRRQEKHELIKKNRKALYEIFGYTVFQSGWPISRKQIKKVLGIDSDPVVCEDLGEFMQSVEQESLKLSPETSSE